METWCGTACAKWYFHLCTFIVRIISFHYYLYSYVGTREAYITFVARQRHTANRATTEIRLTAFDYVYDSFPHLSIHSIFIFSLLSDLMTDSIRCVYGLWSGVRLYFHSIYLHCGFLADFRVHWWCYEWRSSVWLAARANSSRLIALGATKKWKENNFLLNYWFKFVSKMYSSNRVAWPTMNGDQHDDAFAINEMLLSH